MKTVLAFLACIGLSQALYFHIAETEQKCFIEEVPAETMIVGKAVHTQIRAHSIVLCVLGKYKTELYEPTRAAWIQTTPGIGMHVEVKNPQNKVILSRQYAAEGRFTFTAHDAGEHVICIGTNSTRWFGGSKLVNLRVVCVCVCVKSLSFS